MAVTVAAPTVHRVRSRSAPIHVSFGGSGSTTIYCYLIPATGIRGRTADITAVPAGAEVEWTVTA